MSLAQERLGKMVLGELEMGLDCAGLSCLILHHQNAVNCPSCVAIKTYSMILENL